MESWMLDFNVAIEGRKKPIPKSLLVDFIDKVPLEIIEHIIKGLLHNLVAILKCGLVCRTWLALSRRYIFRDVNLVRGNTTAAFLRLLGSPCLTIHFPWTVSLSLAYMRGMSGVPESPSEWGALFPSVRTLRIITSSRGRRCPRLTFAASREVYLGDSFPHLTSLTLRFPLFPSVVDFAEILHRLRCLNEVILIDVRWVYRGRQEPPLEEHKRALLYPLPPDVRTFRVLGRSHPKPILRWLDGHGAALPPIKVFALENEIIIRDDLDVLPRILDTLGPALHHLTLDQTTVSFATQRPEGKLESVYYELCSILTPSPVYRNFLAQNTELQSLAIICLLTIPGLTHFIRTLGSLVSGNFERFEFHFESWDPDRFLCSPSWQALREALSCCPAFSSVRGMYFYLTEHKKAHETLIRRELAAYAHLVHVQQYSDGPQGIKQRWRPVYSEPWRRIRGLV